METRRVRRLERRRLQRVIVVATSICALGFGVGLSLPRSTVVAVIVLVAAMVSLAIVWARAEHRARSHGLRRVVRFPTHVAISAAFDSLRSRMAGTARAVREGIAPTKDHTGQAATGEDGPEDEHFWHFDVRASDAAH